MARKKVLDLSKEYGVHNTTIYRWIRKGLMRPPLQDSTVDEDEFLALCGKKATVQEAPAEEATPAYTRNGSGDWVFIVRALGDEPVTVPDKTLRAIRRAYTKFGGGLTINGICTEFGLPRPAFYAIKTALRWTKDDLPFTDEEIAAESADALVQDAVGMKKTALARRISREEFRALSRDADKARRREYDIDRHVSDLLEGFRYDGLGRAPVDRGLSTATRPRDYCLVVSPTDLHYGKLGWEGFGPGAFNRQVCQKRLVASTERIMADLPYAPECVRLMVGSDWVHVDSSKGTTTKGTPQDMDGVPEQIAQEGLALLFDLVETWRHVAPLYVTLKAGNHDKMLAYVYFEALRQAYGRMPHLNVNVDVSTSQYTTFTYGNNYGMATHGDGRHTMRDLAEVMATHNAGAWGQSTHRYAFRGNLHHTRVEEGSGITSFLLPSLSGADRYHQMNWPVHGRASQTAIGLDRVAGHWLTLTADVLD